ncbi:MAG: hypothetical protein GF405_02535 [Candidatus Eisenbacteria bacterium]|nr:hypothetical protein [Candidatus Eisenbacteria bacterium]
MRLCSIFFTVALAAALAIPAAAETWNTPTIDGVVSVGLDDWDADDWAIDDPDNDCRYPDSDPDMDDLYVTWDADSLYVGIITADPPGGFGNGYVLWIDIDFQDGITGATDFSNADFYARNVTFNGAGMDVVLGAWNLEGPLFKGCVDPTATTDMPGARAASDTAARHIEGAISWVGLYGPQPETVPEGTTLKFVAAIVGGDGSGAYDAMPTTMSGVEQDDATPFNETIDLDVFYTAIVDGDLDGIPDQGYSLVEPVTWTRIKAMFDE